MSAEIVEKTLETMEGMSFTWLPAGSGGMWAYLANNPGHSALRGLNGEMPDWKTAGIACFTLPIVMALKNSLITKDAAEQLLADQMAASGGGALAATWAPHGVQRYWVNSIIQTVQATFGTPPVIGRGDVVYFSGNGAPYFAHVAIATGNGSETMSFGHAAPAAAFPTPQTLERKTIEQIFALNNRLTACHVGAPAW